MCFTTGKYLTKFLILLFGGRPQPNYFKITIFNILGTIYGVIIGHDLHGSRSTHRSGRCVCSPKLWLNIQSSTLRIVTDEWTHVFVMQLPERHYDDEHIKHIRKFNCSEIHGLTETSCRSFVPLFTSLLTLHEISYRRVRSMIDHIYEISPDDLTYRKPSGLFDLGGKILNSFFGVATTEQLDALRAAYHKRKC